MCALVPSYIPFCSRSTRTSCKIYLRLQLRCNREGFDTESYPYARTDGRVPDKSTTHSRDSSAPAAELRTAPANRELIGIAQQIICHDMIFRSPRLIGPFVLQKNKGGIC